MLMGVAVGKVVSALTYVIMKGTSSIACIIYYHFYSKYYLILDSNKNECRVD